MFRKRKLASGFQYARELGQPQSPDRDGCTESRSSPQNPQIDPHRKPLARPILQIRLKTNGGIAGFAIFRATSDGSTRPSPWTRRKDSTQIQPLPKPTSSTVRLPHQAPCAGLPIIGRERIAMCVIRGRFARCRIPHHFYTYMIHHKVTKNTKRRDFVLFVDFVGECLRPLQDDFDGAANAVFRRNVPSEFAATARISRSLHAMTIALARISAVSFLWGIGRRPFAQLLHTPAPPRLVGEKRDDHRRTPCTQSRRCRAGAAVNAPQRTLGTATHAARHPPEARGPAHPS